MNELTKISELPQVRFVLPEGAREIEVRIGDETVWLNLGQMAGLFGRHRSGILRHLRNIFRSGELSREETVTTFPTVQTEGRRPGARPEVYYNLDAIIAVGFHVNSERGTQFRRWANRMLKERLIQERQKLREFEAKAIKEVQKALQLASQTLATHKLAGDEAAAILQIIDHYASSWSLLLRYDEKRLPSEPQKPTLPMCELTPERAREAISSLKANLHEKGEASDLFGLERGDGLPGILGNIEQTFGGEPLYPDVETRAANLLYFVIKDHPFADGNKRIGCFLFLQYLELNNRLKREDGSFFFDNNALVALALLIAESGRDQRETMVSLVLGLLG